MPKALIATVGTGKDNRDIAEALFTSVKGYNPNFTLLLCSSQTVSSTLPLLKAKLEEAGYDHEVREYQEVNDVKFLHRKYCEEITRIAQQGFAKGDITTDYTSGTKSMSAALVLAAFSCDAGSLSYIAGERGGGGRVQSGTEKMETLPTHEFTIGKQIEQAKALFSQHQYKSALSILEAIPHSKAGIFAEERTQLITLGSAFHAWDLFHHQKALKLLKALPNETGFLTQKQKGNYFRHLKAIAENNDKEALKADLYANAERRAEEGKYDDAIARLYRLLELIGQHAFEKTFGCTTSNIALDKLSDDVKAFVKKENPQEPSSYYLALEATFQALEMAGTEEGSLFVVQFDQYRKNMHKRNHSILAHGINPLVHNDYNKFRDVIQHIWQPVAIITFPVIW